MHEINSGGANDWRTTAIRRGALASTLDRPTLGVVQLLAAQGERRAAEAACREIIAREPGLPPALNWLAAMLEREGRRVDAEPLRRKLAELEARAKGFSGQAADEFVTFQLAADGYGARPMQPPRSMVVAKFDEAADRFDTLLRDNLAYRTPELVHAAVLRAPSMPPSDLDILDVGCGTGLAAPLFRPMARRLHGVDLSSRMLEKAEATQLYDDLQVAELLDALAARPAAFDLVLAIDVLIYFGDLTGVMCGAAAALRAGGWFAFSVEAADDDDTIDGEAAGYVLRITGRYAHSANYVRQAARAAGLPVVSLEPAHLRLESLRPVHGLIVVVSKPAETT